MDLFSNHENASFFEVPTTDGELLLMHDFLSPAEAGSIFTILNDTIQWKEAYLHIYGKTHLLQREIAWYGDADKTYKYSGLTLNPLPWTKDLYDLKQRIEVVTSETYNTVLLNKYRHGNDKVAWHSDHEKEFGRKTTIASLSLGTTRHFDIRSKKDKSHKYRIDLQSGSLLVMKGEFQHKWEHQVPRQKNLTGVRINLTFRQMKVD